MRYELAIFDLDGTILYTLEDLADSLNHALLQSQYPARSLEEVRQFVGNGIGKLIERGVPGGASSQQIDRVHRDFTENYRQHCADKTRPYEGIRELLEELRLAGMRTAVVSNKADYAVSKLCGKYFDGLFDACMGECAGVARKPEPDMVYLILDRLQIPRERAVYIGDSEVDVATAKNAGVDGILVSWGFRTKEYLRERGASVIVDTPGELARRLML